MDLLYYCPIQNLATNRKFKPLKITQSIIKKQYLFQSHHPDMHCVFYMISKNSSYKIQSQTPQKKYCSSPGNMGKHQLWRSISSCQMARNYARKTLIYRRCPVSIAISMLVVINPQNFSGGLKFLIYT